MPLIILDARGHHLFPLIFKHLPLFLNIYIHFFSENSLVGCPPTGCPEPSHPPAPPLHATVQRVKVLFFRFDCLKTRDLQEPKMYSISHEIFKIASVSGAPPQTPLGELTTLPQTP